MKSFVLAITMSIATLLLSTMVHAAPTELNQETKDDIAKHEQISAAHAEAAKCLREGKADEVCEGALLAACKGIAIGKFCGMKH